MQGLKFNTIFVNLSTYFFFFKHLKEHLLSHQNSIQMIDVMISSSIQMIVKIFIIFYNEIIILY